MDEPNGRRNVHPVSLIRATANVLLLLGAIVLIIAWASHWPPKIVARVALATIAAFLVSFVSILVENRIVETEEGPEDGS